MRNQQKAKTKNQQPNGISSVKMRVLTESKAVRRICTNTIEFGIYTKMLLNIKSYNAHARTSRCFLLAFCFQAFLVVVVVAAADVWLNQLQNKNIFGDLNSILAITTVLIRKLRKKIITSNVHLKKVSAANRSEIFGMNQENLQNKQNKQTSP